MPCTALKIINEDGSIKRIKFLTIWNPPFTDIDLYNCNEDFIPMDNPVSTQVEMDEDSYHKKLRTEASGKGHFVPEESTDPQWNPGYIEIPDEESENQAES